MRSAKTPLASLKEGDERWLQLKAWIEQQIADYKNPRISDIILTGKKMGLKAKDIRNLVQTNIDAYRQTTSKVYQNQKKSRMYNTRVLGVYQGDIAFFGKIEPELGRLSVAYTAGCLLFRDILNKYCFAIPLKDGRKAKSIAEALRKFYEIHEKTRDYPVRAILFDGERGINSIEVRALLAKKDTSLHIIERSNVKAQLAEALVAQLRSAFSRIKIQKGPEEVWHKIIDRVVEAKNEQPIIIRDKRMQFAPKDVTQKTLGKFLKELEKLAPAYLYSHFSIDTSMFEYKFEIGDYVALKMKSKSTKINDKRSEIAVDAEEWRIIDFAAYYSSRLQIVLSYIIEAVKYDVGTQKVATEDSLVKIVPTQV